MQITRRNASFMLAATLVAPAAVRAGDSLAITGTLSPTDQIAVGYDGPNSPLASTFYYDLYFITVDTAGNYDFSVDALSNDLAPWLGVYANNFNAADYWSPAPLDFASDPVGGGFGTITIPLTPGTYQLIAASVDWIEEALALDEGEYKAVVQGPPGSNITLIPAAGTLPLAAIGAIATLRRRR